VQKHLLPIYEDLSNDNLLQRCLGGYTQNANESFNGLIWHIAPKHLHSGLQIVEVASFIAASLFNEGHTTILKIMNALEITLASRAIHMHARKMSSGSSDRTIAAR